MKQSKRDRFSEFFCTYIQFRPDRGAEVSVGNLGHHIEQAGWVADVVLGLFLVLIRKGLLNKKDMKEIFWHGQDEETQKS